MSRTETTFAASVVVLGLLLLAGVRGIAPGAGYDRIGPRFFPIATATGMILIGAILAISARRRPPAVAPAAAATPFDLVPFGYFVLAFVLFIVLLERAGFAIAAAVQFWLVARAFRSRRPVRDLVTSAALSLIVYVAFSKGLGLDLPAGILEGLL
ncbi:MAG: tripartite tricarboxylate transporter TctB family protein [Acidobacteriota bacterium]